jgi:NAD(P)-dependent dehydrogenase (short-subunit alcohol dehydrogenase family)
MQDFNKKVAVITGGASGIGLALARRALQEGMSVVLADVEDRALADAKKGLAEEFGNDRVYALRTDVSQVQDVDRLARSAYERFGAVHLLFNNAGVGAGSSIVESTLADWKWMIDVNLMGIVHGIHIFVPRMIKQGVPCHVINTASIAGMIANGPGLGIYKATKHAVVSLSETFYFEMKSASLPIGVSVLCPGFVRTRIHESDRNRPTELSNPPAAMPPSPEQSAILAFIQNAMATAMSPDDLAGLVFQAIRENRFYILTHPEYKPLIAARMEGILAERNPEIPNP